MSAATLSRPLAMLALPDHGAARLAAQAFLVLVGTLVMALAAHAKVPFWPVPMTLQTLALFTISALYGRNLGVATMIAYLVEGAIGLPVFASGGGLAYLAGPTAGYLFAYVPAAAVVGYAADRGYDRNLPMLFGAMMVGEVIVLALGAGWLAVVLGAEKAIAMGVGPFIVTDMVKVALAATAVRAGTSLVKPG